MAEVVVGLESILALQEKADTTLLLKLFGIKATSIQEKLVEITSSKSLDLYLYTVGGEDRIVHRFDFNTIVDATGNFSETNKLSFDKYKSKYKGRLQNGKDIAIAHYHHYGVPTYEECMKEASVLVKFEHENVIQLLGYCIEGVKVYLIYDFALYATLDTLNSDPTCNLLDWNKRYKIILGVAKALVYLHNHAPVRTKHRDVISKNILLDASFDPKLSGFVFATTITEPDCIPTTKADVYTFGVLVLETITGQRIFDPKRKANNSDVELTGYVKRKWLEGTLSDINDPRIDTDSILMTKLIEIGLLCVQKDDAVRPTMEEVVDMLLGTSSLTHHVMEMRARLINGEILRSRVVYD